MGNASRSNRDAREELAGSSPVRPTLMDALDIVGELLEQEPKGVFSIGYTWDFRGENLFGYCFVVYDPKHPPSYHLTHLDTFGKL